MLIVGLVFPFIADADEDSGGGGLALLFLVVFLVAVGIWVFRGFRRKPGRLDRSKERSELGD